VVRGACVAWFCWGIIVALRAPSGPGELERIETMTAEELASYRFAMFSDRDTLAEALEYAYSMRDPAVTTAVHVVLNTVIKLLEQAGEHTV
jgi:hypothetical protein